MSHSGSNFYKPFVFVLGSLVLLTVFLIFVANTLSPDSPADPLAQEETRKSIAPVGRSRVVESPQPAATEVTESAGESSNESISEAEVSDAEVQDSATTTSAEAESVDTNAAVATSAAVAAPMKVKAVVATNCAGCHNDGLYGAAKTGDSAAWSALSEQGIDQLTASVINGKGKMPARAESTLNDAEIRQAVELMISNATGNAATATESAAVMATTATTEAAASTSSTAVGEVPAAVKQVVDTACSACHIAGVANAPKFGDKDAWAPRIAKGIDSLTASVIAGVGVMPPRGGTTLDDEQMRLAIEYMLSK